MLLNDFGLTLCGALRGVGTGALHRVLRGDVCVWWGIALMSVHSIHSVLILRMEWSGTKAVWSQQADACDGSKLLSTSATCSY